MKRRPPRAAVFAFLLGAITLVAAGGAARAEEPRIVNIYNFVRENDFRLPDSRSVLYHATDEQIQLLKRAGLPATFALQYDALVDPDYQKLFKQQLPKDCELAAWWEIPQVLAEKAGLKWRGEHEWDPRANVGFSPGYSPAERRKLVDVYMADFKGIFGFYPRTVGSWYIDEVTLAYLADRYHIVASCNCKDQVGTDFYTLWGGYWNQAYYPSRVNAYMPAQSRAGQINVPIFRMLGSDPIYQHGTTPGMFTLEPVYPQAGGSTNWVDWFMDNLVQQPALAFGFTQAGQENSFGWEAMKTGLSCQIPLLAELSRAGKIRVETLAQAGQWFRRHHSLTPPTAVVALDDWRHENRRSIWYDSRFYRLNLLWQDNAFFIRDLHCFDEHLVSPTHDAALAATSLAYETLPVMDWALWSKSEGRKRTGLWPVLLSAGDVASPLAPTGPPVVREISSKELSVQQPLADGGLFSITCGESGIRFAGADRNRRPLPWALVLDGGAGQKSVVRNVAARHIDFQFQSVNYQLNLEPGTCEQMPDGTIRLKPDASAKLALFFKTAN